MYTWDIGSQLDCHVRINYPSITMTPSVDLVCDKAWYNALTKWEKCHIVDRCFDWIASKTTWFCRGNLANELSLSSRVSLFAANRVVCICVELPRMRYAYIITGYSGPDECGNILWTHGSMRVFSGFIHSCRIKCGHIKTRQLVFLKRLKMGPAEQICSQLWRIKRAHSPVWFAASMLEICICFLGLDESLQLDHNLDRSLTEMC